MKNTISQVLQLYLDDPENKSKRLDLDTVKAIIAIFAGRQDDFAIVFVGSFGPVSPEAFQIWMNIPERQNIKALIEAEHLREFIMAYRIDMVETICQDTINFSGLGKYL